MVKGAGRESTLPWTVNDGEDEGTIGSDGGPGEAGVAIGSRGGPGEAAEGGGAVGGGSVDGATVGSGPSGLEPHLLPSANCAPTTATVRFTGSPESNIRGMKCV